jgi:hypothetical protein
VRRLQIHRRGTELRPLRAVSRVRVVRSRRPNRAVTGPGVAPPAPRGGACRPFGPGRRGSR